MLNMAFAQMKKSLGLPNGFSDSGAKFFIAIATGAAHQIITSFTYRCPCVNPADLDPKCSNASSVMPGCSQHLNLGYGLIFVAGPAVGLFFLGLALQTNLWKLVTGWLKTSAHIPRKCRFMFRSLLKVTWRALASPLAWICFALLDGRHFACAYTPLPYDVGHANSKYINCHAVSASKTPTFSHAYLSTQTFFQVVGCASVATFSLLYFMFYCIGKCRLSLTYYQAEYLKIYKSLESELFDKKMKEKALEKAERLVDEFFKSRKKKEDWDEVMFGEESPNEAGRLYESPLQKWALQHKKIEENSLESGV